MSVPVAPVRCCRLAVAIERVLECLTTWSALLDVLDAGAVLDHAGALVAEDGGGVAGRVGAGGGVQVGVADAAGDEADEHLAVLRLRAVKLLDLERLSELFAWDNVGTTPCAACEAHESVFLPRRCEGHEVGAVVQGFAGALFECVWRSILSAWRHAH